MTEHDAFDVMMETTNPVVYLVTTVGSGERSGCLVGFAAQMSIHPLRFVLGISKLNHTHKVAAAADFLAVHVVDRDHPALVRLFAGETGDEIDKFADGGWTDGPHDLPILADAGIWFVGRILDRLDVRGDHTCYVLEPVDGAVRARRAWLRMNEVDVAPGHPE